MEMLAKRGNDPSLTAGAGPGRPDPNSEGRSGAIDVADSDQRHHTTLSHNAPIETEPCRQTTWAVVACNTTPQTQ